MSMSDPIADMLTRLRNGIMRRHTTVAIPGSKIKENIASVLLKEGFIDKFETLSATVGEEIVLHLKYSQDGDSVIRKIDRVSKPGLRVYKGYKELKPVLNGQGIFIISTSSGVRSDNDCRKNKLGGEVLCSVY